MIRFGFSISWPWRWTVEPRHFAAFSKHIAAHKTFELQISRFDPDRVIDIDLDLNWRGRDHAGPKLELSVLGYYFSVGIYDNRHWNHNENRWENDYDWGI